MKNIFDNDSENCLIRERWNNCSIKKGISLFLLYFRGSTALYLNPVLGNQSVGSTHSSGTSFTLENLKFLLHCSGFGE